MSVPYSAGRLDLIPTKWHSRGNDPQLLPSRLMFSCPQDCASVVAPAAVVQAPLKLWLVLCDDEFVAARDWSQCAISQCSVVTRSWRVRGYVDHKPIETCVYRKPYPGLL